MKSKQNASDELYKKTVEKIKRLEFELNTLNVEI